MDVAVVVFATINESFLWWFIFMLNFTIFTLFTESTVYAHLQPQNKPQTNRYQKKNQI